MRKKYGDLVKLPGLFGRKDILISYDAKAFEKVIRTEGSVPIRDALEAMKYYRYTYRQDIFSKNGGLAVENGPKWLDMRTKVNPVLMQPKTIRIYIEKSDQIARELMDQIRDIRDPNTFEMTDTFGRNLKQWALESVGLIALDQRLGALKGETEESRKLIQVSKLSNVTYDFGYTTYAEAKQIYTSIFFLVNHFLYS